jgi:hypothetical protein
MMGWPCKTIMEIRNVYRILIWNRSRNNHLEDLEGNGKLGEIDCEDEK